MGQQISRVYGYVIKRPIQRFNIENRAFKVLDKIEDPKEKAMRAPMFQSDKEILEQVRKTTPNLETEVQRKDSDLDDRLKDVYVQSYDPPGSEHFKGPMEDKRKENADRPKPADRSVHSEDFVPGLLRMDKSGKLRGKVNIDEAVELLTAHAAKPDVNTVESLADQYRLNADTLADVVKHFKVFKVFTPPPEVEKKRFDPLQAGKDWVESEKESLESNLELLEKRKNYKKELELKDKERAKIQKLGAGDESKR